MISPDELDLHTAFSTWTPIGAGAVATWVVCHRNDELHLVKLLTEREPQLGDTLEANGSAWTIHRRLHGGLEGWLAAIPAA